MQTAKYIQGENYYSHSDELIMCFIAAVDKWKGAFKGPVQNQ